MKQILKTAWLVYRRKAAYWILSVFCGAAVFAVPLLTSESRDYITLLDKALAVNGVIFAIIAILSFEMTSQMIDDPDTEALNAIKTVKIKTIVACFVWVCGILIGICILELGGFLLRAAFLHVLSKRLLNHICKVILLYAFLPGVAGAVAGSAFSGDIRGRSYVLIILFTLLFSPAVTNILPEGPLGMMTRLDEWVRLFPSGTGYGVDPIYGIPLESSRFALIFFWIFLFLVLRFARLEMRMTRSGRICLIVSALLMLMSGGRFCLRTQDSVMDAVSCHGMVYEDSDYYETWKGEEKEADFIVTTYDLKLKFRDHMKAEARVTLADEDRGKNQYNFTLHHGLKVTSVKNEFGVSVPFVQDGDWLDIYPEHETNCFILAYSGHIARHYSNRQCVFLPGYVAYYPVPGHISLWDRMKNCIKPVTELTKAEFSILIDSPISVVSNLQQSDENMFQGITAAPTILGGFISCRMDGNIKVFYPALMYESIEYQESQLEFEYAKVNQLLHIYPSEINALTMVFVLSPFVRFNSEKEECVYIEDYFTHANMYQTIDYNRIVQSIVLSRVKEDSSFQFRQLLHLFSEVLSEDGVFEQAEEKPEYERLEALIQYDTYGCKTSEDLRKAQMAFNELFYYQMNRIGREEFCSRVYAYLIQSERKLQPIDFLYRMEE